MAPVEDLELTRDEIARIMEDESRDRYGISAEKLIKKYLDGDVDECGGAADILSLASLLDAGDPLSSDR